eukprot:2109877-Rhodomonas_salina.1
MERAWCSELLASSLRNEVRKEEDERGGERGDRPGTCRPNTSARSCTGSLRGCHTTSATTDRVMHAFYNAQRSG